MANHSSSDSSAQRMIYPVDTTAYYLHGSFGVDGWPLYFCRTSRIFSCKLCFDGNMSLCNICDRNESILVLRPTQSDRQASMQHKKLTRCHHLNSAVEAAPFTSLTWKLVVARVLGNQLSFSWNNCITN